MTKHIGPQIKQNQTGVVNCLWKMHFDGFYVTCNFTYIDLKTSKHLKLNFVQAKESQGPRKITIIMSAMSISIVPRVRYRWTPVWGIITSSAAPAETVRVVRVTVDLTRKATVTSDRSSTSANLIGEIIMTQASIGQAAASTRRNMRGTSNPLNTASTAVRKRRNSFYENRLAGKKRSIP